MKHQITLAIVTVLLSAPAMAQDTRRLSPAEVERVLEEVARKRVTAEKPPARLIEGEVGVSIGTGGYREVFGTAVVPISKDGTAIISIGSEESDRRTRRRR
jgi:hypothetical protein